MNKKIIIGIAIAAAIIISVITIDALKTTLGDEAVNFIFVILSIVTI